ncbi:MAG: prolyl oligopeptidase family serine peptidase [Phycisphaeraceae bacterium]
MALTLLLAGRTWVLAVQEAPAEATAEAATWRWFAPPTVATPGDNPAARMIIYEGAQPANLDAWTLIKPDDQGWLPAARGAYLAAQVYLDQPRVMMLQASGNSAAYINGHPRLGDHTLPVFLRKGENILLVRAGGTRVRAVLSPPSADAFFNPADPTMPDGVAGQPLDAWAALPVINATTDTVKDLAIRVQGPGMQTTVTSVTPIAPLSVYKARLHVRSQGLLAQGPIPLTLELVRLAGATATTVATSAITLEVVKPGDPYRRTFISHIDDSVQYFAVRPAIGGPAARPPALTLALHGAGVEAIGLARAYAPNAWMTLVAPTNRRPYGFNWEDWGRLDALEVLELAQAEFRHDPTRVYLTGHSMGGHGTWILGTLYPDRFAALGPSAAWVSHWSYRGSVLPPPATPFKTLMRRLTYASDPLPLIHNMEHVGIYLLHGGADNNVRPSQAHIMVEALKPFHRNWVYHEEPNAGHWWSDERGDGGATCLTWPAKLDFLARNALPRSDMVQHVRFTTPSPGVAPRSFWVTVEQQQRMMDYSTVDLHRRVNQHHIMGTTNNVKRLSLDVRDLVGDQPVTIELDAQTLDPVALPQPEGKIHLSRGVDGNWTLVGPVSPGEKNARRYGPIKDALRHRLLLVYGTAGSDEENQWALTRARLDAERFWFSGNAALEVIADVAFDATTTRDRDVILYGHGQMNTAWTPLLSGSPVQVSRSKVTIGNRTLDGDDLACMFLRPRPDSDTACVFAMTGTGELGMRLANELQWFYPFGPYPDVYVAQASRQSLQGQDRLAGFFGMDWSVERGEFVWDAPVPTPAPEHAPPPATP